MKPASFTIAFVLLLTGLAVFLSGEWSVYLEPRWPRPAPLTRGVFYKPSLEVDEIREISLMHQQFKNGIGCYALLFYRRDQNIPCGVVYDWGHPKAGLRWQTGGSRKLTLKTDKDS